MGDVKPALPNGPQPGVTYPIRVMYCGNCSLPLEYCEYYPEYDRCKAWLQHNLPNEFEKLATVSGGSIDDENSEEKKRQKRGGKGYYYIDSIFLHYLYYYCSSIGVCIMTAIFVSYSLFGIIILSLFSLFKTSHVMCLFFLLLKKCLSY